MLDTFQDRKMIELLNERNPSPEAEVRVPCRCVPKTHDFILPCGGEQSAVRRKNNAKDLALVCLNGPQFFARVRLPQADHSVVTTRNDALAVRGKRHGIDGRTTGELAELQI